MTSRQQSVNGILGALGARYEPRRQFTSDVILETVTRNRYGQITGATARIQGGTDTPIVMPADAVTLAPGTRLMAENIGSPANPLWVMSGHGGAAGGNLPVPLVRTVPVNGMQVGTDSQGNPVYADEGDLLLGNVEFDQPNFFYDESQGKLVGRAGTLETLGFYAATGNAFFGPLTDAHLAITKEGAVRSLYLKAGTTPRVKLSSDGTLLLGDAATQNLLLTPTSLELRYGTTASIALEANGTIRANRQIIVGSGPNNIVGLDAQDAVHRMWAGHASPGLAPFRVSATGQLWAVDAVLAGEISAVTGDIGNWLIDTNGIHSASGLAHLDQSGFIEMGSGSNIVRLDAANDPWRLWVGNSNPAAALFRVDKNGNAWAENLTVRGTIKTTIFEKNQVSAINGALLVTRNAGVIRNPTTYNASDGSTLHTSLNPDGTKPFALNEIVRFTNGTQTTWMKVNSAGTIVGDHAEYVMQYKAGAAGAGYGIGRAVVSYGPEAGGGVIYQTAEANPYISIMTHTGTPWTPYADPGALNGYKERVRIGEMNGAFGCAVADRYGLGIGDFANGNYFSYNAEQADQFLLKLGGGAVHLGDMYQAFGTGANHRIGIGIGDYANGNYLSYNATIANAFVLKAGAGAVTLDADGLSLIMGESWYDQRSVTWDNGAGGQVAGIGAWYNAPGTINLDLVVNPAGAGPYVRITQSISSSVTLYANTLALWGSNGIDVHGDVGITGGLGVSSDLIYGGSLKRGGTFVYPYVPLAAPISVWSNANIAVGTYEITNVSLGIPAEARAVEVLATAQWSTKAAANRLLLRTGGTANTYGLIRSTSADVNTPIDFAGAIYCADSGNGIRVTVEGLASNPTYLVALGYYI